ncbi:PRKN ligase, partial [Amia calva]|nr:PRKN ligase [Amia calva]
QYERYLRYGAEECVLQMAGVLCPAPGCGAGLLPEPGQRNVQCQQGDGLGCGFVFCRECKASYHDGDCSAALLPGPRDAVMQVGLTEIVHRYILGHIYRNKTTVSHFNNDLPESWCCWELRLRGCMHMTCPQAQCRFEWCWLCGVEWNRECMGDHWF